MSASQSPAARTPGAKRAGPGEYVFDFKALNQIMGGPGYSPVFGGCVEGERMIVALMRAPAGQMGEPHTHPNEQWIYFPAGKVHQGGATEKDTVFFTCKDASHGLHGAKAAI